MPRKHNRFVTLQFVQGRLAAAYIYLVPRESGRTVRSHMRDGYVIDYVGDEPVGIEIVWPGQFDLDEFNRLLESIGHSALTDEEARPFLTE